MNEAPDSDQRYLAIMEEWVARIVREVADEMTAGIVKEVGRIFLDAKKSNFRVLTTMEKRLDEMDIVLRSLIARKP